MILGSYFYRNDGNPLYSPQFPRGGLGATFVVEINQVVDAPTFLITIQHKNMDETTFTDAASFASITATGTFPKSVGNLKEVLRFKYSFTSTDAADGVHFLMLAPTWSPS
ncbi:MAG: hypothetical protein ACT4PV_07155 [Planctomycetaceae bacterium]